MATLLKAPPIPMEEPQPLSDTHFSERWLIFRYAPVALFSLKMSRATSTAGKTLLIPTPYSAKMAFVDVALRHNLTADPEALIQDLAKSSLRIGVPQHACVTSTIQSVRQETRASERKRGLGSPLYQGSIAMREFVHYQGDLRLAFDSHTCAALPGLLLRAAPAINYLGKRGGFVQYLDVFRRSELDSTFTEPVPETGSESPEWSHRATLDDFGFKASFHALNSFSAGTIEPGAHRRFVETIVPLQLHNAGPGFLHYTAPGAIL